jgi:diguanylate cyclase (GGDEF)-like protein
MTHRLMDELRERQMESRHEEDHARRLARLDPLTGLNNRRAFDETLDEQIALARANGQSLSVLLADIDGFKQINDDHGHMNGDSCLRQVARTIQVSVRATDACFRWGGDEFALVLPSTDRASADRVAERVSRAVESGVALPSGSPLHVRCGSAQFEDGMDAEGLLNAADAALIAAKDRGPDAGAAAG